MNSTKYNKGVALFFTMIFVSVMLIISALVARTALQESTISRDEVSSLQAFYAADTVTECLEHYQKKSNMFSFTDSSGNTIVDPNRRNSYDCGVGDFDPSSFSCTVGNSYDDLEFDEFGNNAYAVGSIRVTGVDDIPSFANPNIHEYICHIDITVNGQNKKSGTGLVERTRYITNVVSSGYTYPPTTP